MSFTIDPLAPAEGRAEAILPLAVVKKHVAVEVDETEFDDLLEIFRDAAVEEIEGRTGKLLAETSGLVWRGDFPARHGSRIDLARGPLVSVQSVDYLDGAGQSVAMAPEDFAVRNGGSWIAAMPNWPHGSRAGSVEITFTAGYSDAARPRALMQAALMLCAHYFDNREAVLVGQSVAELPLGVNAIVDRYRDVTI